MCSGLSTPSLGHQQSTACSVTPAHAPLYLLPLPPRFTFISASFSSVITFPGMPFLAFLPGQSSSRFSSARTSSASLARRLQQPELLAVSPPDFKHLPVPQGLCHSWLYPQCLEWCTLVHRRCSVICVKRIRILNLHALVTKWFLCLTLWRSYLCSLFANTEHRAYPIGKLALNVDWREK